ncbi:MAG: radical SAM protein [Anaerolineales bacterium]|nr:MAG: radical SAM protein [Anaerolineales bacterium]
MDWRQNLGSRRIPRLPDARFPDVSATIRSVSGERSRSVVDVLLVNPPAPDGGIWIRSQHRVGRRSRENMIWPQVSLAQLAAMLHPDYSVEVVDAIAERMGWEEFQQLLRNKQPRYYVTQVTAPTLTNDMYGTFLARSLGAKTIAFGTHVTPMTRETMGPFPSLDFILRGEPELTLRELIDTLEGAEAGGERSVDLSHVQGLAWRRDGQIVVNADRPFIPNLDDLPLPMHHLLPLDKHRIPMLKGPYTFVVTSRGCPGGCCFCIKHVSYQYSVRVRSPENIMEELWLLKGLGIHNIHMYTDLFTVDRQQVIGLCNLILKEGLKIRWTCNSRVDFVDEEMLQLMGKSGCWMISWGIESGSEEVLKRAHKGISLEKAERALRWSKAAGIKNWGYFIIGLPGETEETIQQTINFSKKLPLDLALFHIAAPYPGTPFFFEVLENGWFRPGTRWEEVDMDRSTVLDYPGLSAEQLEQAAQRAFREWAMRPGPVWTFLKSLNSLATLRSALSIGLQHLSWIKS